MYSNLVDYVRLSPNCTKPRNKKIDAIVIHHMAGNLTVEQCGSVFAPSSRQASSNYGVGTDGRIACYVEEENRAWTTGNREIDNRAITIEVANCSGSPEWRVSDQALEAVIALCADICKRYNFKLNYTGNKSGNLHMHKWYQSTSCPGPYLAGKFPHIADEVNKKLSGNAAKPATGDTLGVKVLSKGGKGAAVKALQLLLIGNGYSCGKYGADSDFGSSTDSAVKKFKQAKGLGNNGVVDAKTWGKLLGFD